MDLKQLESFVRVAELGSFTRAATALGLPQPLLSRHVRQLEVELRQTFMLRNGRGVTLTDPGLVLLEHGRGILHQVALAREELEATRGALGGHVSIGLPPSLSKLISVPLTLEFRKRMPQARLTLTEGFSVAMNEGLRSGRLDMALLYNTPHSPDIEIQVLRRETLVLIASEAAIKRVPDVRLKSRMPLATLAELPLILPSRPNAFRILIETELVRLGLKPRIELEVDGLNAILELVGEGLGFAVLPPYTLSHIDKAQVFSTRKLFNPQLVCELMLVTSAHRPVTGTHKAVQAVVADVVREAMQYYR
ncbi:LysR family transcriptional regulator [Curvibacter sp. CHRR-16]|uniref:LysR substrate-binding domain-containing protein n=1 Tax=Curvibacter sp. CHRR-16 TaxID=2835872 RepID=UPI001BDA31D5|nr:LysR substrate-binding domain-containing protein [Curvibacter sp. CHRR-16]MBT0568845.1 LysR family transcriptional regulator [Curvibacter sp. CHRR-16]